ncbi:unnamed protein product [Amoebophrya sp. A120]|nr:unnamed protein product [Amoebophrya sp. A120]|eukprot:GSA120T00016365001.1
MTTTAMTVGGGKATGTGVQSKNCFVIQKQALSVRIQPLALMTILDAYARIPKKEHRAIGTLMGMVSEGNILEIVDAFQVVHSDLQQAERGVLMDQNYHGRFVKLRQHVNNKEQVVGWFSVGEDHAIDENTLAIHQFYRTKESKFTPNPAQNLRDPVYLQVDTTIRDCAVPMEIKIFTSDFVAGTDQNLIQFYELPIVANVPGAEMNIVQMLSNVNSKNNMLETEEALGSTALDNFLRQLQDLKQLFGLAREYIADVLTEKKTPNPEVGRALSRALEGDIIGDEDKLDALINGATQDVLMCRYLSSLCKAQIVLAEKIQHLLAAQSAGNQEM